MKLADGVTIHTGGRKYKGEIPDNMLPKNPDAKKYIVDKQAKKVKAQEKEKAAAKAKAEADKTAEPDAKAPVRAN